MTVDNQQLDWLKPHDGSTERQGPKGLILGLGNAGGQMLAGIPWPEGLPLSVTIVDSDLQTLTSLGDAMKTLSVGSSITRGYGCAGDAYIGLEAARSQRDELKALIEGHDWVAVVTGLGGGLGSGAASFIAELAADMGALVIGVATLPFQFEGTRRAEVAQSALEALQGAAHAVVTLPNQVLIQELDESATVFEAFEKTQQWIHEALRALWSLLYYPGPVKTDFMSLKRALSSAEGKTLYGLGMAQGLDAARKVLQNLFLSPLLHTPGVSQRADQLVVAIRSGYPMGLHDLEAMVAGINERFSSREQTLWSYIQDDTKAGQWVQVCVLGIATSAPMNKLRERRAEFMPATSAVKSGGDKKLSSGVLGPNNKPRSAAKKQEEFEFFEHNTDQRGAFQKTSTNLFEGEDLDVPTYLRRGIKIKF